MYAAEKQYIVDTLTMYISLCLNISSANSKMSSLTYYIIPYIEVTR